MGRQRRAPAQPGLPRPRYRRITAAGVAALVTAVAVLGATGILPTSRTPESAFASPKAAQPQALTKQAPSFRLSGWVATALPRYPERRVAAAADDRLPARSGTGKRIVFDISDQRVWLVNGRRSVTRTHLVSGSLTDNLASGNYEVFSKSLDAVGIDDSGTMRYMVRFAHGGNAAIGFHDIPILRGEKVQTPAQLGSPQSHGCIRQLRKDAKALWRFAPVGTKVVVLD